MLNTRTLIAVGLLAVGAVAPACNCYPEPSKTLQPPKPVADVPTKVAGVFLDAKSQQPVAGEVSVSLRRLDGSAFTGARDISGKASSTFTVTKGALAFSIDDDVALPVTVVVVARADGYNATSAKVEVPAAGAHHFIAQLVNLDDPPAGAAAVKEAALGSADGTGTLPMAASVSTPAEANTGASTTLDVPANTKVTAADGTPLTGNLTASVTYFNNVDTTSLAAFPGGLANVEVPPAPGEARAASTFVSAGFTAIEIRDGNGNRAASFSQPVTVTMEIPSATLNPLTGSPVADGDVIPFWSYDEATGVWSYEGEVTVTDDGAGNLIGSAEIDHLSYFNLDWVFSGSERCAKARKVVITGNPQNLILGIEVTNESGYYNAAFTSAPDVNSLQLLNAPAGLPMTVRAVYNGEVVGSVNVTDLCSGGDLTLAVNLPNVQASTLDVTLAKKCSADENVRTGLPGSIVLIGPAGKAVFGATGTNGTTGLSGLASGETYTVYAAAYDGTEFEPKSIQLAAGSNALNFDTVVECPVVSGAGGGN